MAIVIQTLVEIDLEPVFTLDPTLQATIPTRIEATMATLGWTLADLTDQRSVYVAAVTTLSFVPRLLLKFGQEIKKAKGGKAETEFFEAIKYLQELRDALNDTVARAASGAGTEDIANTEDLAPWPSTGVLGW